MEDMERLLAHALYLYMILLFIELEIILLVSIWGRTLKVQWCKIKSLY